MMRKLMVSFSICCGLLMWAPQLLAQDDNTKVIITLDGHSVRLLGFIASGPQADLDRLLAAAATTPLLAKQPPPPDGPEVMVFFKPGTDPKVALDFLSRAKSSEFSALKIGLITYPVNP
jgi:hypothetical protein